jgi:hypothetical protein
LRRRTAETNTIQRTGKLSDIMTGFPVLRSRLTGTLTTPDDTDDTDDTDGTDGVDSTIRHRPDAVVRAASEADVVETGRFARALKSV